jgi:hypothetical protein
MACKCKDLETRLDEALEAANKFRTERDESRLRIAKGIRMYVYTNQGLGTTVAILGGSGGNSTLILDEGVAL